MITLFGKKSPAAGEWPGWEGVIHHYIADQVSGDLIDLVGGEDIPLLNTSTRVDNYGIDQFSHDGNGFTQGPEVGGPFEISGQEKTIVVCGMFDGDAQYMIGRLGGGTNSYYFRRAASNVLEFYTYQPVNNLLSLEVGPANNRRWCMGAMYYSASEGMKGISANGKPWQTAAAAGVPAVSTYTSAFNRETGTVSAMLSQDQIIVWNRILSSEELSQLYNRGRFIVKRSSPYVQIPDDPAPRWDGTVKDAQISNLWTQNRGRILHSNSGTAYRSIGHANVTMDRGDKVVCVLKVQTAGTTLTRFGVSRWQTSFGSAAGNDNNSWVYRSNGSTIHNSSASNSGYDSYNDDLPHYVAFALDGPNRSLYFWMDGTWQGSSDPVLGTNPAYDNLDIWPLHSAGNVVTGETLEFVTVSEAEANGFVLPSGYRYLELKQGTQPSDAELENHPELDGLNCIFGDGGMVEHHATYGWVSPLERVNGSNLVPLGFTNNYCITENGTSTYAMHRGNSITHESSPFNIVDKNWSCLVWFQPHSTNDAICGVASEWELRWQTGLSVSFSIDDAGVTLSTPNVGVRHDWNMAYIFHDADNDEYGVSLNGGPIVKTPFAGGVDTSGTSFRWGLEGTYFDGEIDQIFQFNKVLDHSQVLLNWNNGKGGPTVDKWGEIYENTTTCPILREKLGINNSSQFTSKRCRSITYIISTGDRSIWARTSNPVWNYQKVVCAFRVQNTNGCWMGIGSYDEGTNNRPGNSQESWGWGADGNLRHNSTNVYTGGPDIRDGNVHEVMLAYDGPSQGLKVAVDGVWQDSDSVLDTLDREPLFFGIGTTDDLNIRNEDTILEILDESEATTPIPSGYTYAKHGGEGLFREAVGSWSFDNPDTSGDELDRRLVNDLIQSGSPGYGGNGVFGNTRECFLGGTGFFQGSQAGLNLAAGDFSASIHIYPTDMASMMAPGITFGSGFLAVMTGSSNQGDWWVGLSNNGELTFATFQTAGANLTGLQMTTDAGLTNNNWYHIAVVQEGGAKKVYVDGVEKTLAAGVTTSSGWANYGLTVGAYQFNSAGYYYGGWVDELNIFPRALTPAEVTFLGSNSFA